jgi:hypothetical protein
LCWIRRHIQPQIGTTEKDASGSGPQLSVDGASSSSGQPSSSFVYNTIAFSNPTDEVARIKAELGSLQTHLKVILPNPTHSEIKENNVEIEGNHLTGFIFYSSFFKPSYKF